MRLGITTGSLSGLYAEALAAYLLKRGLGLRCILYSAPPVPARRRLRRVLAALRGAIVRTRPPTTRADEFGALHEFAADQLLPEWGAGLRRLCRREGIELLEVADMNAPDSVRAIRGRVDLLVNAGGGIFRRPLIEAFGGKVLNAHMGLLPDFRGMNALEWSLLHGVPPGVTIHLIDTGIDTGEILDFREIAVSADDSIASLRAKSLPLSVELTANGIVGLQQNRVRCEPQRRDDGRQYFVMHPRLRRLAERRIRIGRRAS